MGKGRSQGERRGAPLSPAEIRKSSGGAVVPQLFPPKILHVGMKGKVGAWAGLQSRNEEQKRDFAGFSRQLRGTGGGEGGGDPKTKNPKAPKTPKSQVRHQKPEGSQNSDQVTERGRKPPGMAPKRRGGDAGDTFGDTFGGFGGHKPGAPLWKRRHRCPLCQRQAGPVPPRDANFGEKNPPLAAESAPKTLREGKKPRPEPAA